MSVIGKPVGEIPQTYTRPRPYYDLWQEREGIPVYKQFHVDDLGEVELKPWARFGGNAAFVNLADPDLTTAIVSARLQGAIESAREATDERT